MHQLLIQILVAILAVDRLNLNVVIAKCVFFWQDLNYSNGGEETIPTTVIGGVK